MIPGSGSGRTCSGYGGHFLTKSRRYSVTFGALRSARISHRRAQRHPGGERDPWGGPLDETTVLILATWTYAGTGYSSRSPGAELAPDCLITEHAPGRYAFHDLLRAYAADKARECDSQHGRRAAIGRILDHYLHTAAHAARLLRPDRQPVLAAPPSPGTCPERPGDHRQALAWFEAEHQVLLAAAAEAMSLRGLGSACATMGDYDQASAHLERCLSLYQRLGDRMGEAWTQQTSRS